MVLHGQFLLQSLYPLDKGKCSLDRWHSSSSPCPVVKRVKFVPKLVFMWKWKQPKWKTHFSKRKIQIGLIIFCHFSVFQFWHILHLHFHKKEHMTYEPQHPFFDLLRWFSSSLAPAPQPSDQIPQSDPDKTPDFRTEQVVSFCTVDGTPQDSNTYWVEPGWVDRGAEDASINEVCYSFVNLEDPHLIFLSMCMN